MPPNGRRPASRDRRCRPSPRYGEWHAPHAIACDGVLPTPPPAAAPTARPPPKPYCAHSAPEPGRQGRGSDRACLAALHGPAQRGAPPHAQNRLAVARRRAPAGRAPDQSTLDPRGWIRAAAARPVAENSRYRRQAGVLPWRHRRRSSPAAIRRRKPQPPPPASAALRGPSPVITGVRS